MPERPQILSTQQDIVRASSARSPLPAWRRDFQEAIRDLPALYQSLELPIPEGFSEAASAAALFPVLVPLPYLSRIQKGNPADPLLLQVLSSAAEMAAPSGFSPNPLAETAADSSLIQKYQRRTLVITTGACAVHCRYCFRRHFPYSEANLTPQRLREMVAAIQSDPSLDEVILSGGDPLSLSDRKLNDLIEQLSAIAHLRRLRIHTRLPVVIPNRVTKRLVRTLQKTRLATWFVVHINHAQEIDKNVERALARLIDAGIPVLNQAVLLRGVNDSISALENLCRKLANLRVAPYYLHQLDRVVGAAHFEVPEIEGRQLIAELRERLPGYAVPTYVREIPGENSKTPLE